MAASRSVQDVEEIHENTEELGGVLPETRLSADNTASHQITSHHNHSDTCEESVDHRETSEERVDYRETSEERVDYRETSEERVDYRETSEEIVDYRETSQKRVDHRETSEERVYHRETSEERVDHRERSKERDDHRETSEERVDHRETCEERVDHSETYKERIDHRETSKERVDHRETSEEIDDHRETYEERIDHRETSEERVDHSETFEERVELRETFEERVDHRETSEERIDYSETSEERFEHGETSEERVDHMETFEERVDHRETSEERVDRRETSEERVDHSETSEERVDHSETSEERVDNRETSEERVGPDGTSQDVEEISETYVEAPEQTGVAESRQREVMQATVNAWRQEKIYKTKGVVATQEKILSQDCVCVVGVPGAGKSTAIHHAALSLENNGFIIYCIHELEELFQYFDEDKKQVFVLDDVLGIYSLDQGKVNSWDGKNDKIRNVLDTHTKLLVSIRTQLYNQAVKGNNFVFLSKSTCIDLSDRTYRLDGAEMIGMLTHCLTEQGVDKVDDLIRQIWWWTEKELQDMTEERRQREIPWYTRRLKEFSDCFPLLCKVFCSEEFVRHDPMEFFKNPFQALTKIFLKIKSDNKLQFCGLVLCSVFDGKLTEDMFSINCEDKNESDVNLRDVILKAFHLEGHLLEIKSALNSIDGVYVTHVKNIYQMSHRVFHDVVTYLFNDTNPWFVLKYGTSEFIHDRIRLSKTQPVDDPYMIIINDDKNIERLADRLFRDLMSDRRTRAKSIAYNTDISDERLSSWLIRNLSDIVQTDKQLVNVLFNECMRTLYYNISDTYKLIVFCLQSGGVDCNIDLGYHAYPLHISVMKGSLQLAKLLLHNGADKRRVDWLHRSVLHYVCSDSKHRLDIIKLLTQDVDLSVVEFITRDKQKILQGLEDDRDRHVLQQVLDPYNERRKILVALDSDNVELEEVLSDNSTKVLTTDKYKMKDYVEHSEDKLQLVRRVHDNILTHVDGLGRNILHYSVDNYDVTEYLLSYLCLQLEINRREKWSNRTPYWYVVNNMKPVRSMYRDTEYVVVEKKEDMVKLYTKHGAVL